jgi:hypothetical protein
MAKAWTQQDFRWRNDDGSQTTATWAYNLHTNATPDVGPSNLKLRLRIQFAETGTTAGQCTPNLYVQKNGSGGYAQISASATNGCKPVASDNFADNAATTQQLGSGTFVAGAMDEADGKLSQLGSQAQNVQSEVEYMLQFTYSQLADNDYFDFRVYNSTTALGTYTYTPRITINKLAAYSMDCTVQTYDLSGVNLTAQKVARLLSATLQTYVLAGKDLTSLTHGYVLVATKQTYAATFNNLTSLLNARRFDATTCTYALAGIDLPGAVHGYMLFAEKQDYVLAGKDLTSLLIQRLLSGIVQTYSLSGQDLTSLLATRTLSATVQSYLLSGVDSSLKVNRVILPALRTFALEGIGLASLRADRLLSTTQQTYALSGVDLSSISVSRLLSCDSRSYTVSYLDVLFTYAEVSGTFDTEVGEFNVAGGSILLQLTHAKMMGVSPGVFDLTGLSPALVFFPVATFERISFIEALRHQNEFEREERLVRIPSDYRTSEIPHD